MVTKEKIFFLLYSMHVGGVEKSLVNLLSVLSREEYDIHVGLVLPEGDLLPLLPSDVTIHHVTDISKHWHELKEPPLVTIKNYTMTGHWMKACWAILIYLVCKVQGSLLLWVKYLLKDSQGIGESFDVAVAYAGPATDIDYYICKKVNARRKIGWVHFDIAKFNIDIKAAARLYKQYSNIYVVSEMGKKIFVQEFPEFKEKTEVFHNVVSSSLIREQANNGETFQDDYNGIRVLTVGRISPEKGQREAIHALKLLIDKGYRLRWYFVGEGIDVNNCRNDVEKYGLSEYVIFLGTKINPYAYMRDCDIYVQPSRYEGFCITLAEALCFENPIVSTDFTGAREQLENKNNGIVVGMDASQIAKGVEKALNLYRKEK